MKFADSHCHLDYFPTEQLPAIIRRAQNMGVDFFLNPGVTMEGMPAILKIAEEYSAVLAGVAVHPNEEVAPPTFNELSEWANNPKVVAIGETGLDFSRVSTVEEKKRQEQLLEVHLEVADSLKLPIILHSRECGYDLIKKLKNYPEVRGMVHCFTDNEEAAEELLALGYYLSFSGIVTFKKADNLRALIKGVPLDRILLETDAPYLAPVPMRGQINEPGFLPHIAHCIANLLEIEVAKLAASTTQNFFNFIGNASCL